jgi:hypothetical protein
MPQFSFGGGHIFSQFFGSGDEGAIVGKMKVAVVEVLHD